MKTSPKAFNVGMPERQSSRLVASPLIEVYDVVCRAPRAGSGALELTTVPQIVLARRGAFIVQTRREPVVVDTNTALVFGLDEEYRVSHPTHGGDDCTVLVLPPDLLEEALGAIPGRQVGVRPLDHMAACLVTRALREPAADQLDAEDAALLLLSSLSRAFAERTTDGSRLGPAQRLRVEQARALLASSPAARWDLNTLGRALRCSPFHLARQFRAATGETISRYLLRLRLGAAVERLAEGERDIAALAIDVGFAHHSHFSARFRGAFGITPTQAREMLTKRKLDELRAVVAGVPSA
jgi:AraC family transcriptional regulator